MKKGKVISGFSRSFRLQLEVELPERFRHSSTSTSSFLRSCAFDPDPPLLNPPSSPLYPLNPIASPQYASREIMLKSQLLRQSLRTVSRQPSIAARRQRLVAPIPVNGVRAIASTRILRDPSDKEYDDATTSAPPGASGDHEGQFARTDSSVQFEHPEEQHYPKSSVIQGRGGEHNQRTLASFSLEGKVGVVTGGARGLGLVMTQAMVISGADVAIVDMNSECSTSSRPTFVLLIAFQRGGGRSASNSPPPDVQRGEPRDRKVSHQPPLHVTPNFFQMLIHVFTDCPKSQPISVMCPPRPLLSRPSPKSSRAMARLTRSSHLRASPRITMPSATPTIACRSCGASTSTGHTASLSRPPSIS